MNKFKIHSAYQPSGDQPQAIEQLTKGLNDGQKSQVLLGVTGSGKTFTVANVIENVQKPTLVLCHNKTLAAQLTSEFKQFFPDNAVEYFVSYYDYYQPESYIPRSDLYIEKDMSINDEIDRLRHSATSALLERKDVIVVSSVSCIYSLGSPEEYQRMSVSLRPGMKMGVKELAKALVAINFERNDIDFDRGCFRVRGDTVEVFPTNTFEKAMRVEFFGDTVERISEIEVVSGRRLVELLHAMIFPATHYAIGREAIERGIGQIEADVEKAIKTFQDKGKLLEAERIAQRTQYDIEMMREVGYCTGIENYSRYFDGRSPGQPPFTLMDYFPDDFLLVVDESHVTLPQVRAMYKGDFSRKDNLVNYGFRLPSAYDNRPLKFEEFNERLNQAIYVSATPAEYERELASGYIVEQIVRPTGLVDPEVTIKPIANQVDDLMAEIQKTVEKGFRVLVTTLTKKMAERLTDYYEEAGIKVRYMHSDVDTMDRMAIIRGLRLKEFDVLVGINLLREGLDLPEVALVAILDADKEGFLRNETSLIQTIGRAARNVDGRVVMYADRMTRSMDAAIKETDRRRTAQREYNEKHGITPQTIIKEVADNLEISISKATEDDTAKTMSPEELEAKLADLEQRMRKAAIELEFELAAALRDEMIYLSGKQKGKGKKR
ncbi:MAG: excinuclease ABC subunit UvrB [Eubacteriales bacterium]